MKNEVLVVPSNESQKRKRLRTAMQTAAAIGPLCSSPSKPCALGYNPIPYCCPPGGPQPGIHYYQELACCSNDQYCGVDDYTCKLRGWELNQCTSPSAWCPCQQAGYCNGFVCVPRKIAPNGQSCKVQPTDAYTLGTCRDGLCQYSDDEGRGDFIQGRK